MKVTHIDSLKPYLKNCYKLPIGKGTTAVCYLMKDGQVLKVFKNTYNLEKLLRLYPNLIYHFHNLSKIKNDSYITPEELLVLDDNVAGYIYPYVKAKDFKDLSYLFKLEDIFFSDGYKKLQEDTQKISEKYFELFDSHDENILFDGNYFYNIDLDFSQKSYTKTSDEIYNQNMKTIQKALIYSLLGVRYVINYNIFFNDRTLDDLYNQAVYANNEMITQFIQELIDRNIKTKLDTRVKKHQLIRVERNDYYNRIF